MKRIGLLISRYLLTAILPYFAFSWLLLSVILFVQQASRFSDIFFSVNIPSNLVWQLTVALIPNVIAFTCPMAILVGTIIGLTKMQGDSELVAIRASGVGNLQIAMPIMLLGVLLSAFAFLVNIKGVPLAATLVRSVALQTALKKLESPIEPGVFNTEVAGFTIYVKGGDLDTGRWQNIFIYKEDKANGTVRLITSQKGRIDTEGQASELVLENASISTLPITPGAGKYVSESIGELRFAIQTRRSELIEKLTGSQISPEELGLQQLSEYADSSDGKQRVEAQLLWQRRIILSITPLIFCLLGTMIVLRFNRGGRGFGIAVALIVLIGFYLLAFLGEQLARTGTIGVAVSSFIPLAGSLIAIIWFSLTRKLEFWSSIGNYLSSIWKKLRAWPNKVQSRNFFVDLTTGLRDFDLIVNLVKNFALTLCFLASIFVIFTAFELWKFAGTIDGGVVLLAKYLLYLLPFVYLQIAPSAAMIAVIATYVIKSRQNEIVTWASAGQSVYRLLAPCFLLTLVLGGVNWTIQEKLLPRANRAQDAARNLIRNRGLPDNRSGKYWVANDNRILSFEIEKPGEMSNFRPGVPPLFGQHPNHIAPRARLSTVTSDNESGLVMSPAGQEIDMVASDNALVGRARDRPLPASGFRFFLNAMPPTVKLSSASDNVRAALFRTYFGSASELLAQNNSPASDNEKRDGCRGVCVRNLSIYEFANNGADLQAVYRADQASWEYGKVALRGNVEKTTLAEGKVSSLTVNGVEFFTTTNPFVESNVKPAHLDTGDLKRRIDSAEAETDQRNLTIALERKYSTLILPFVLALFTAPFSLSLSRKGKAATVGYAVGLWLLFTGTSSIFEQLGLNGILTPQMAIWSPLAIFALFGVFLLSRVRT